MDYRTDELCGRRRIKTHDITTPLLVPSFSSKGFPNLKVIWKYLNPYLPNTILVSCYDIYHNLIELKDDANLVFLDSGGYETNVDTDLPNIDQRLHQPRQWNKDKHFETLRGIESLNTCVTISFDNPGVSVSDQIADAEEYYLNGYAVSLDFLLKPSQGDIIDIGEIRNNVDKLSQFDILGITEKELGHSIADRMRAIADLRMMLSERGLDIPIHIFGCFDPASIWLYFLCGADVFDGLSWLRYSFVAAIGMYRNSWAILTEQIKLNDQDILYKSCLDNIQLFVQNQRKMTKFVDDYDRSYISIDSNQAERLLNSIGISLEGKE